MKTRAKCNEEKEAAANTRRQSEEGNQDSDLPTKTFPNPYVCVYCGTPCSCLYRQLNKNSLSSIKAMHCENCHRIVDPYIEREWLLVLIDCILLRPEAYRHVLYNNQDLSCYVRFHSHETDDGDNNNNICEVDDNKEQLAASTSAKIRNLVQWTVLSSLFHAYLKWQALLHAQQRRQLIKHGVSMPLETIAKAESSTVLHVTFILTSLLDLAAQWLAIYGFIKLLSVLSESTFHRTKDARDAKLSSPPSHSIAYQIYLGLLLPTSFQVVCVLVLLWENSKTSTALGSLLIAFWQYLGISILSIQSGNSSISCSTTMRVLKVCTPLVGILSLIAWRFGVGHFLSVVAEATNAVELQRLRGTVPCVGFEMDVSDVVGVFSNKNLSLSSFEWDLSPLLLCLS